MVRKCIKVIVTGHVQGVGFRFHTAHEGLKNNLAGYAKNLPNGSVEVLVCGEEVNINSLLDWLKHGPKMSRVDAVQTEEVEWRLIDGFTIK